MMDMRSDFCEDFGGKEQGSRGGEEQRRDQNSRWRSMEADGGARLLSPATATGTGDGGIVSSVRF